MSYFGGGRGGDGAKPTEEVRMCSCSNPPSHGYAVPSKQATRIFVCALEDVESIHTVGG